MAQVWTKIRWGWSRTETLRSASLMFSRASTATMVEASGEAARALAVGEVDAACLLDGKRRLFESEGMFAPRGVTVLARTHPFDHCNLHRDFSLTPEAR